MAHKQIIAVTKVNTQFLAIAHIYTVVIVIVIVIVDKLTILYSFHADDYILSVTCDYIMQVKDNFILLQAHCQGVILHQNTLIDGK